MIARCYNPKHEHYHYYGGRGITVCDEWRTFQNFLWDMGEAPVGKFLERKDNDKGYSKANCVWATRSENGRNKRNNIVVEYRGTRIPLISLAELLGYPYHAMLRRIKQWGMGVQETIEACKSLRKVGVNKRYAKTIRQDS